LAQRSAKNRTLEDNEVYNKAWIVAAGALAFLAAPGLLARPEPPHANGDPPGGTVGGPLPGLTSAQLTAFKDGQDEFGTTETPEEGLGPVFNGTSCAECHAQPIVGGASPDLGVSVVTRIG